MDLTTQLLDEYSIVRLSDPTAMDDLPKGISSVSLVSGQHASVRFDGCGEDW